MAKMLILGKSSKRFFWILYMEFHYWSSIISLWIKNEGNRITYYQ